MVSPIKDNPFTAEEHKRYFAEFCLGVQRAGGTTPHMLMAVESTRKKGIREALWRGGCYAFVYNMATAEIIWKNWDPGEWTHDELVKWIADNWKGLKFRKERKAARSPERLATCMDTYYAYMLKVPYREWFWSDELDPEIRYRMAFDDICDEVKYMGRYIAIRWLEFVRRAFDVDMPMPDIFPKDGDHPRKALALMFPEDEEVLMRGGNCDSAVNTVNLITKVLQAILKKDYSVDIDFYTMQSLLCEYKQSCLGGRQYPGKSVDTAVAYLDKVYEYWGEDLKAGSEIWQYRKNIFPSFVLGEEQGWNGVRNELGKVLREYGYTWSDYLYDYAKTTDLANPVERVHEAG